MNLKGVIHNYLNGFGLPAYEECSLGYGELKPELPYITYGHIGYDRISKKSELTVDIWYKNGLDQSGADEVEEAVSLSMASELVLTYDEGVLIVTAGEPFSQNMPQKSKYGAFCRRIKLFVERVKPENTLGIFFETDDGLTLFGEKEMFIERYPVGSETETASGRIVRDIIGFKRRFTFETVPVSVSDAQSYLARMLDQPIVGITFNETGEEETSDFMIEVKPIYSGNDRIKLIITGREVGLAE